VQENSSRHLEWDHDDQMRVFRTQTGTAEPSLHAHYLYGHNGQRVKKLVRKQGGQIEVTIDIDGLFEHHRRLQGGTSQDNTTVQVMDNQRCIALMRVGSAFSGDTTPAVQFHLGDHLGSSNLMLDDTGAPVNREEYTPYGETSFGSFARKRYRYTGKQRDEESGLYYHGARYYAPWLVRWVSCDPLGSVDGPNLYIYASNNPVHLHDPTGTQSKPSEGTGSATLTLPNAEDATVWRDPETNEQYFDFDPDPAPEPQTDHAQGGPGGDGKPGKSKSTADKQDGVSRSTGQAAATTWDSHQRGRYVRENARASRAAQEAIEQAHRQGNARDAWKAAEEVSAGRNARRVATQKRLTPGGRALSAALEGERNFIQMAEVYASRLPGVEGGAKTGTRYAHEVARRIAVAAGESRASIKTLAKVGRVLGPIGLAAGVGLGIHAYATASEDQKGRVAAREVGSFVGGLLGASVGTSAGVALAGGVSGLLIGLGIAAGPLGWLAIGLGILGGLVVGWWWSHRGSQVGGAVYDAAQ
jgi:RHS repeat-associated protein